MTQLQIQRLQNDSIQLERFAKSMIKEGKQDLVEKIKIKKEYIDKYLEKYMKKAA